MAEKALAAGVTAVHPMAIRLARAIHRGTAESFAALFGVNRTTVQRYENAVFPLPVLPREQHGKNTALTPEDVERLFDSIREAGADPIVTDATLIAVTPRRA